MLALWFQSARVAGPHFCVNTIWFNRDRMLNALRYYWMVAKGYRLRPWRSPYLQWRMETFFGAEADNLDARKFLRLMWRERVRMKSFAAWAAELRRAQKRSSRF